MISVRVYTHTHYLLFVETFFVSVEYLSSQLSTYCHHRLLEVITKRDFTF
jgi:hypothetical protein